MFFLYVHQYLSGRSTRLKKTCLYRTYDDLMVVLLSELDRSIISHIPSQTIAPDLGSKPINSYS